MLETEADMDIFLKDDLTALVEQQTVGCMCISIYMPTIRPGLGRSDG